jgi:PAT family beta-lactamase induction signal transducer AmpG
VLSFIFLYKLGDTMATALATKFFLDVGFTMKQIGVIAKTVAFWTSIAGGIVGGVFLVKIGIARGLWIFGVLQIVATIGFAWLAKIGPSPLALGVLYGFETFATGLTLATFTAYIASTTDPRYTATQFALFTSLAAVPRTVAASASGFIVAQTGWFEYFLVCVALSIPGMLLLPLIAPWRSKR